MRPSDTEPLRDMLCPKQDTMASATAAPAPETAEAKAGLLASLKNLNFKKTKGGECLSVLPWGVGGRCRAHAGGPAHAGHPALGLA